jgi:hypothetical protein
VIPVALAVLATLALAVFLVLLVPGLGFFAAALVLIVGAAVVFFLLNTEAAGPRRD